MIGLGSDKKDCDTLGTMVPVLYLTVHWTRKSLFPFIDSLLVVHLCTQITKRAQDWYRIVQPRLWCSQELLALQSKLGRWSTATNLDVSVGTASEKLGWFWPRNTSICIKMIGTRALSIVSVPHEQGKYSNNCEYCPGHSLTVSH